MLDRVRREAGTGEAGRPPKNVGNLIIGHSRHRVFHELLRRSLVQNLPRLAGDVDVYVVANRGGRDH